MASKLAGLVLIAAIGWMLIACSSAAEDVPSLGATPTAAVEEDPLDDEKKMMAFTQCMRDEGIELVDAGVDADGNVQRPILAEGAQASREDYQEAMEVCGKYLEAMTRGRERQDMSEQVDKLVALATCLREKGYGVEDPTAETLDQWDFKSTIVRHALSAWRSTPGTTCHTICTPDVTPVEHHQPVPLEFGNVRARSDGVGHVRIAGTATNETSSAVLGSVSGRDATIVGTLIDGAGRIASVAGEVLLSPVHILRLLR